MTPLDPGSPNEAKAEARGRPVGPLGQVRVWHLGLLVLLVAVGIANIQDQRRTEPALIGLAAAGLVLYIVLGWAAWRWARPFEKRLGAVGLLAVYLIVMAGLFLGSTWVYLRIERIYLEEGL